MKKQQVLHKGQVLRGYLRAGTQILVQRGTLHIQYAADDLGASLWAPSEILSEGEIKPLAQGWVCLSGDAEILIMDAAPASRRSGVASRVLSLSGFLKKLAGVFDRKRIRPRADSAG